MDRGGPAVVGVDLGGTHLRAALVSRTGEIHALVRADVNGRMANDRVLERITQCVLGLFSPRGRRPEAVGLVVPGGVDARTGVVTVSPNYPSWRNFDLAGPLGEALGMPVVVANDNSGAALGELWKGDTRGEDTFCYVAMGTGVGGGIVIGGELHRGVNGMAGEVGHIVVDPNGPRCGCGRSGCLETFASGKAIARMGMESIERSRGRILERFARARGGTLDGGDVHRAALLGDPRAREVFRMMGTSLGSALADIVNVLNPPLIILGGAVSRAWRFFIPAVRETIRRSSFPLPARSCRIARSKLIDRCGILGAARIAWDRADPPRGARR